MTQWYVAVEGRRYGPVTAEQLGSWAQKGRLTAQDLVWRDGMAEWVAAGTVEELRGLFTGGAVSAAAPAEGPPPTPPGGFVPGGAGTSEFVRPHRGGIVLALGILGLVVCVICGAVAWAMGNTDLKEMAAGRMDRSGEGMTRAGKICGMISVILVLAGVVVWFLIAAPMFCAATVLAP